MARWRSTAVVMALTTMTFGWPLHAAAQKQSATDAADEQELKQYRLSLDTLRKVDAAFDTFWAVMQNDPRFKAQAAAKRELEALKKKEEPTEADEQRIEALEKQ